METYVKFISETEITLPAAAEFPGVIGWQQHDAKLREKEYFPLRGKPDEQEGKELILDRFALHRQTKTVLKTFQVVVDDYEMDPENPSVFKLDENGERIKSGQHTEFEEREAEVDDSCISVEAWHYDDLPEPGPEPEPVVRYSKYRIQLACQKRGLWEQVKAAIAAAGMSDSWANIIDISSDNPELVAALPAISEAFGADVVDAVLEEGVAE